jgi:hypothetical protein
VLESRELDHNKGETKGYSSESGGCRGCTRQRRWADEVRVRGVLTIDSAMRG